MTAIKERLIGAITVMSEQDAEKFWHIIQEEFLEEAIPSDEELEALKAYQNGDEGYQPTISHAALKKELGIE